MNAAFLPPAYSDAHSLLKILADPVAAQKRLDELSEHAATAGRLNAETGALAKAAATDRAENEKLLSALAIAKRDNEAALKRIAAARLDEREAAVRAREREIEQTEKAADAKFAEASALKDKWQTRMDRLKAAQAEVD